LALAEAAQAPAEPNQADSSATRIHFKIKPCCHLGLDDKKQVVFIFFDSRNELQE
jgi:hypothetical protein